MAYSPLTSNESQAHAKQATIRQLLKQYDALNQTLLLGKEEKFTGFYHKTISQHQATLLDTIVKESGITTKELDDSLEKIDSFKKYKPTKIDGSLKRLHDACLYICNLNNDSKEKLQTWLNSQNPAYTVGQVITAKDLAPLVKTQHHQIESYKKLLELTASNPEANEQIITYREPNPTLKRLQQACDYVIQLSPDHQNEFKHWLTQNSTYSATNSNINRAIREIALNESHDVCYKKLKEILKNQYKAKNDKAIKPNWKQEKQKLLKDKQGYLEYFLPKTKEKLYHWLKDQLTSTDLKTPLESDREQINTVIDASNLYPWTKHRLKNKLEAIVDSNFDQSLIDGLDLIQYDTGLQNALTDYLNKTVNEYRQHHDGIIITNDDEAVTAIKQINLEDYLKKMKELTEENYRAHFDKAVSKARDGDEDGNGAKQDLNEWVNRRKAERTRFEASLEHKTPNALLVILAQTTKQIQATENTLDKLNSASYHDTSVIIEDTKDHLSHIILDTINNQIPTDEELKTISGPQDSSLYEINETRKTIRDYYGGFEENPEIFSEEDRLALAAWIKYQTTTKELWMSEFKSDIGNKLSIGFSDWHFRMPNRKLRLRIEQIIEDGSFNQITQEELDTLPKEIKDWLENKRAALNAFTVTTTDNIKELTDNYYQKIQLYNLLSERQKINAQLHALLDKKAAAINDSLLGKTRHEYEKAKYRDLWTRRGIEHALGFSVSAALTMGGSLILLLIGITFFGTVPGLSLMFFMTAIVLGGVYLGNWWITKHDVAELFLTIFPDPDKSWLRQFIDEAKKNTLAFTVSNFAAFLSALFTAVAAFVVVAEVIIMFTPITLPITIVLLALVALPSFYYTYPTYFAISHIFSRIMTRKTYASHLKQIEEIALINDKLSIRSLYPYLVGLAMLAILGVMLAAAPTLFFGFAAIATPFIIAQVVGYVMVLLSMGGIGSFYLFRSRNAAVRYIKDQGGRDPFKDLKENTLLQLAEKSNPHKLLILANILEQLNKLTISPTITDKLKQAIVEEIFLNKQPNANFLTDGEKQTLEKDQGTLGKLYRIYQVRDNAQEALTLWGKSFETIRFVNAWGNMLPSVFGFIAGLPAGTPIALIWALGILAGVGGTGASWAANSNGIEADYTVQPELHAAQKNLNDLVTISWFTNLNSFTRALNYYKNKHKDFTQPDYAICVKLKTLCEDIRTNGYTKIVISDYDKEIIKNSDLNKLYTEMGDHLVRAVEIQQGKKQFLDTTETSLLAYITTLGNRISNYKYGLGLGYSKADKQAAHAKLLSIRLAIKNNNPIVQHLTPKEIEILKNGDLGKIYNQMDKYTLDFIELNGYLQESTSVPKKAVAMKLLKISYEIKYNNFTTEHLSLEELAIAKNGRLGKIYNAMDKTITAAIELKIYKIQVKNEDVEEKKTWGSISGWFAFAKTNVRTFLIKLFGYSFSFTLPRLRGYSKEEKWFALEALETPIKDTSPLPTIATSTATVKKIISSKTLQTIYSNGRLGSIYNNLDRNTQEALTGRNTTKGELEALIEDLNDFIEERNKGKMYSTGETNLGTISRPEKITIAAKLCKALTEIRDTNCTTCQFTDEDRKILSDGKLNDIYVKAQKYIDMLSIAPPARMAV